MRRFRRPQLALIGLIVALAIGYVVQAAGSSGPTTSPHPTAASASTSTPTPTSTGSVPVSEPSGAKALSGLPVQARQTVALIDRGGPFPYPRNDGVIFHNAERRLPAERDGYYHEYTVPTPGSDTRGARRIITGGRGEVYYTSDHYQHFVRVDVTR